jgi:hypothetical protein
MNLGMSFWFRTTLPIQSYKTKPEALCQLALRLVNQKISELNSHAHLIDHLDYESEVLGQFMNLSVSFCYTATLPIQSHKNELKVLCQLTLSLVNQKISEFNLVHLTNFLDYESKALCQFIKLGASSGQHYPSNHTKSSLKRYASWPWGLVNHKISDLNSHAHLTDLLDYEYEVLDLIHKPRCVLLIQDNIIHPITQNQTWSVTPTDLKVW